MRDDTTNYQGVSLFETYQELWRAINNREIGVSENGAHIKQYYDLLSTFPFIRVAEILSNEVRRGIKDYLPLLYLPYTMEQAKALNRLRTIYPTTKAEKQPIIDIINNVTAIETALEEYKDLEDKLPLYRPLMKYIDVINSLLYQIDNKFLWIVIGRIEVCYHYLSKQIGKHNGVDTAREHIRYVKEKQAERLQSFEKQLVEDVTTCLVFRTAHPDMVLALENAVKVLNLFYTPVEASKLFIDNVAYKLDRYIKESRLALGEPLMKIFTEGSKYDHEVSTANDAKTIYQKMLDEIKTYQQSKQVSTLQKLLELHHALSEFPFKETQHLAGFTENMWYVSRLQQEHIGAVPSIAG
nr:MAG TPA: hypothetical protein [Caudoviricetes sp.]